MAQETIRPTRGMTVLVLSELHHGPASGGRKCPICGSVWSVSCRSREGASDSPRLSRRSGGERGLAGLVWEQRSRAVLSGSGGTRSCIRIRHSTIGPNGRWLPPDASHRKHGRLLKESVPSNKAMKLTRLAAAPGRMRKVPLRGRAGRETRPPPRSLSPVFDGPPPEDVRLVIWGNRGTAILVLLVGDADVRAAAAHDLRGVLRGPCHPVPGCAPPAGKHPSPQPVLQVPVLPSREPRSRSARCWSVCGEGRSWALGQCARTPEPG